MDRGRGWTGRAAQVDDDLHDLVRGESLARIPRLTARARHVDLSARGPEVEVVPGRRVDRDAGRGQARIRLLQRIDDGTPRLAAIIAAEDALPPPAGASTV
jgi:hypothetical protein